MARAGRLRLRDLHWFDFLNDIQALSDDGAVNITNLVTTLALQDTGDAFTLANGTAGQVKIIYAISESAGGDTGVLTPTTANGFSTITFNGAGNGCILVYHSTEGWTILGQYGCTVA